MGHEPKTPPPSSTVQPPRPPPDTSNPSHRLWCASQAPRDRRSSSPSGAGGPGPRSGSDAQFLRRERISGRSGR
ncbi:hypothetical protein L837_2103 [Mycobacterium avium MAV_061107_1842]|uniref:Uncharacterized protein n=1 Tax=Mycobacterium avium (strain 104) TaxID=243243 RepID=A0A0H3A0D8_MYCA1|nr:hypothetical protein MAV_2941 [Mycobacterium avium 104]ETZ51332.1 hypothetical protein L837_2103 [Mycobacterium avium MAV_061107_1842]